MGVSGPLSAAPVRGTPRRDRASAPGV